MQCSAPANWYVLYLKFELSVNKDIHKPFQLLFLEMVLLENKRIGKLA